MKLFLAKLAVFIGVQAVIGLVLGLIYFKKSNFENHYVAATIDKNKLLEHQASPRLIFVGGSNLAFGIESPAIEKRLGYHPVNMGLYAALGMDFMVQEITSRLRPKDVVVLSFEYQEFGRLFTGSAEWLFKVFQHYPAHWRSWTASNWKLLLDDGLTILAQITRFSINQFRGHQSWLQNKNELRRDGFNQWGDYVAHYHVNQGSIRFEYLPSSVDQTLLKRAIRRLNSFQQECREKGVNVFYSFPPVPPGYMTAHKQVIDEIAQTLKQKLRIPLLDSPEEMIYPLGEFAESNYHLDYPGVSRRTSHLVQALSARSIRSGP